MSKALFDGEVDNSPEMSKNIDKEVDEFLYSIQFGSEYEQSFGEKLIVKMKELKLCQE